MQNLFDLYKTYYISKKAEDYAPQYYVPRFDTYSNENLGYTPKAYDWGDVLGTTAEYAAIPAVLGGAGGAMSGFWSGNGWGKIPDTFRGMKRGFKGNLPWNTLKNAYNSGGLARGLNGRLLNMGSQFGKNSIMGLGILATIGSGVGAYDAWQAARERNKAASPEDRQLIALAQAKNLELQRRKVKDTIQFWKGKDLTHVMGRLQNVPLVFYDAFKNAVQERALYKSMGWDRNSEINRLYGYNPGLVGEFKHDFGISSSGKPSNATGLVAAAHGVGDNGRKLSPGETYIAKKRYDAWRQGKTLSSEDIRTLQLQANYLNTRKLQKTDTNVANRNQSTTPQQAQSQDIARGMTNYVNWQNYKRLTGSPISAEEYYQNRVNNKPVSAATLNAENFERSRRNSRRHKKAYLNSAY